MINDANKGYLFALKENQPSLLQVARSRLGSKEDAWDSKAKPQLSVEERYQGAIVRRELFRLPVEAGDVEVDMAGARDLWRVRQTRIVKTVLGQAKVTVEDRFFITNCKVGDQKALRLVRLHWGIENNAFWTLDVAMGEDDYCLCQRQNAVVVLSWMRLLAYNIVSLLRSHHPMHHGEKRSWERIFELLLRAFSSGEPPAEPTSLAGF